MADERQRKLISGSFKPAGKETEASGIKGTKNFRVGHQPGTNVYEVGLNEEYEDFDSVFVQLQSQTPGQIAQVISEPTVANHGALVVGLYSAGIGGGVPLLDLAADTNTRVHFSLNCVAKAFNADAWAAEKNAQDKKDQESEDKESKDQESEDSKNPGDGKLADDSTSQMAMTESEGEKSDSTNVQLAPPNKDNMETKTSDEPSGEGLVVDKADKSNEVPESSRDESSIATGPTDSPYAGHVENDVSTLSADASSGPAKDGNKPDGESVESGTDDAKSSGGGL